MLEVVQRMGRVKRIVIGVLFVASVSAWAWAVWRLWPSLMLEHGREPSWLAWAGWTGDIALLLAFASFAWRHAIQGEGWRSIPWDEFRSRRLGVVAAGVALALLLDAGETGWRVWHDRTRRGAAVPAVGTVEVVNRSPGSAWIELWGTFPDAVGQRHEFRFVVRSYPGVGYCLHGDGHSPGGPPLPAGARQALQRERVPFEIPVEYDPDWPGRFWYAGAEWSVSRVLQVNAMLLGMQTGWVFLWLWMFAYVIPEGAKQAELGNHRLLGPPNHALTRWIRARPPTVYWPWELYQFVPLVLQLLILGGLAAESVDVGFPLV